MVTLRDIQRSVSQSVKQATDGQATLDLIDTFLGEQAALESNAGSPAIAQSPAGASDAAVDRLSSEILQLCNSLVLSNDMVGLVSSRTEAITVHSQHYLILRFVRQLLPVLGPRRIFEDWWQLVLRPILTTASYVNQVKKEACTIVADCLVLEKEDDKYAKMIIEEYLAWSEKPQELDDTTQLRLQHQVLLDLEQDEWSRNLIAILLSFGAAETKKFFMLMNRYFLLSKHRLQIVYLLSEFLLKKEGTHLHEILETDLFSSMLKSLMYDNSTTLIAMSVTNLIMLLPRICISLPPHLPQLFYIFARALCWEQLRDMRQKYGIQSPHENITTQTTRTLVDGWDCVDYTFSKLSAPPSNPQTGPLFTSLYGLYPCNFLKFLHNPYAYFQENSFAIPEEFDEETFRNRTLNLVKRHMLHPNLLTMDPETELSDRSRWMTTEAEGVITQIMSLDLTNAASRVGFSSKNEQDLPQDLLDETVYTQPFIKISQKDEKETSKVHPQEQEQEKPKEEEEEEEEGEEEEDNDDRENDEPVTPKQEKANEPVVIGNILKMNRALKSGAEVLVGDDVWEAGLQQFSSTSPTASPPSALDSVSLAAAAAAATSTSSGGPLPSVPETSVPDVDGLSSTSVSPESKLLIAALKREVLLLRNELNFELFVKQQYLQHMARLHRDHVFDSSVEAERQRMYNTTRILRAQLEQTTAALDKLKEESAKTKQRRIRWEDTQSGKVQNFRDEKKKWRLEMEELKQKLMEYEKRLNEQSKELLESQKRNFDLENELKTTQSLAQKAVEYEIRVTQLTRQMLLWEEDTAQLEEQNRYIKGLLSEWLSREELVRSLQSENSRLEQELSKLKSENKDMERLFGEYQEQSKQMVHGNFEAKIDAAKSQAKQIEQLKSTVQELKNRLEVLEIEKFEWQAERERLNHAHAASSQHSAVAQNA